MSDFSRDNAPKFHPETPPGSMPVDIHSIVQIAIETTGKSASLAILQGDTVVETYFLDDRTRTAASLAPAMKCALTHCARQGLELSFISVADGPGSFTGLRIGITTAKTLAYARKLPIVGVDSVAAVAVATFLSSPANPSIYQLRVALDAYRGQAFIGEFSRDELIPALQLTPSHWTSHPNSVRVAEGQELEEFLMQFPPGTFFSGDQKALGGRVADEFRAERKELSGHVPKLVDAVGVGRMAIRAYHLGKTVSPMDLLPRYLRQSAAEEKAALRT